MTVKAGEKRCSMCGETKPLDEFHRSRGQKDGRHSRCKPCNKQAVAEWAQANPGRVREKSRLKRERDPKAAKEWSRRSEARYPEKHRARRTLHEAVKRGRVVKPDSCEDCGQQFEKRLLHGHHEDYSKPLDVNWLCYRCHGKRHRPKKQAALKGGGG